MKIGFIGLGTMGGHMAYNLRKAGYDLIVHDLRPEVAARHLEIGCAWGESVADVASVADVLFTSLPGPREVEAVALGEAGLLAGMRSGTAWFDLSTNSPTLIRRLHSQFADKGIAVLDAPVSGGPLGAESGKLAIRVGGEQSDYEKHKDVLDAIGDEAAYIGPIGSGAIAKLVHNCAGYAIQTALAEVFTMGVKAGLDPLPLWAAVRQGAQGRSRTFDRLGPQFLRGEFDVPSFALRLAHKDVTLATELAREVGVPMRIAGITHSDLTEALNRGWGDKDSRVAMLLQEERAGLETIHVPAAEIDAVLKQG